MTSRVYHVPISLSPYTCHILAIYMLHSDCSSSFMYICFLFSVCSCARELVILQFLVSSAVNFGVYPWEWFYTVNFLRKYETSALILHCLSYKCFCCVMNDLYWSSCNNHPNCSWLLDGPCSLQQSLYASFFYPNVIYVRVHGSLSSVLLHWVPISQWRVSIRRLFNMCFLLFSLSLTCNHFQIGYPSTECWRGTQGTDSTIENGSRCLPHSRC